VSLKYNAFGMTLARFRKQFSAWKSESQWKFATRRLQSGTNWTSKAWRVYTPGWCSLCSLWSATRAKQYRSAFVCWRKCCHEEQWYPCFGVQQELSSIDQHLSVEENVATKSNDTPAENSTTNAFLEGFPPAKFDGIDLLFAMFLKELPALYVCPHHNYYDKHLACNDILFCVFIISFCKQM